MKNESTSEGSILKLIDKIPQKARLTGLEKAILCNDGTVQTMLSAVHGAPVKVEVLHQEENHCCVMRWVRLVIEHTKEHIEPVCIAESIIDKGHNGEDAIYPGFLVGLLEENMGIGQLISSIGIHTKREIMHMYADNHVFARTYKISEVSKNPSRINITITETFPRIDK